MNILDTKLKVAYDQSIIDDAFAWTGDSYDRRKWFGNSLKQRLMVGELRYGHEVNNYNFPDQSAALGAGWKLGWSFLACVPSDILARRDEKIRRYLESLNTENLIDAVNYTVFLYLLGAESRIRTARFAATLVEEFYRPTLDGAGYRPEDRPDDGTKPITTERREWFSRTHGAH